MALTKKFVQNNNTNAICYYRYSSHAQRECSIEQQQQEAHRYCKAHGLHIVKEYADKAITGTRDDRPQLELMLNEVEKIRPAYLILWRSDRLARDRYDATIIRRKLRNCGVLVEYTAIELPKDEANRVLVEAIEDAMAESEVIKLSHNVTRGLKFNAEKALYNGRKILGYIGKPQQRYEKDPITAPIVECIFSDYANGKPMKVIADELNMAGFTTVREKPFTEKSLWHTLRNRSYIGEYRWGDIVVPDGFPPLVSVETFEKVQEMMEKNKHGGRGGAKKLSVNSLEGVDFWLTGKLECGECGEALSGISGTGRSGKLYYYYACINHKKHKCAMKNIRKDDLERIVAHILDECINDATLRMFIANEVYQYYMREFGSDDGREQALVESIKETDKALKNYLRAIEMGIINETTQARMLELEERKRELTDELTVERNRQKYALKKEHVVRYLKCFIGNLNEPSLRDKVLAYLVEKIYIYRDKIVINFYYSEDKREIDFKEFNDYLNNLDYIMEKIDGADSFKKGQKKLNAMWKSIFAEEEGEMSF